MKTTSFILISSLSFTSCATILGDRNHTIFITSTPSGAHVRYDGEDVGSTPTDLKVRNTFSAGAITVSTPKYQPMTKQIQTSFQFVGLVNIIWWPGFLVDLIAGNTMALDQHQMNFVLQPIEFVNKF